MTVHILLTVVPDGSAPDGESALVYCQVLALVALLVDHLIMLTCRLVHDSLLTSCHFRLRRVGKATQEIKVGEL